VAVLLRPVPAGGLRGPRPGGGARVASTASAGALVVLVACFTVVPPLAAFGVYFGLWHAGRHTWRMVELAAGTDTRPAGHGRALRRYAVHALAPTAVALAALLAIAATRDTSVLATEIAVLLALTFPHVQTVAVLDAAGARRGRDSSRRGAPTLTR